MQHVQHVFNDPRFYGPEEALLRCSESMGFIIKTTIWFDVLASATKQVSCFLGVETYRRITNNAFIGDLLTGGAGGEEETPTSMLLVAGCENKVVLARAETLNLPH